MPTKSEKLRDKTYKQTLKVLRQVVAGSGRISGNYYFAGNLTIGEASLLVTLLSKDPKGALVATKGRDLKADISNSRYSIGKVALTNSKLIFTIEKGNADPVLMTKSFKNILSSLRGLNFLRKAIVRRAGEEVKETSSEETVSMSDLELTSGENAELDRQVRSILSREEAVEASASIPAMQELNTYLRTTPPKDAAARSKELTQKMLTDMLSRTGDENLLSVTDSLVDDFLKLVLNDGNEAAEPLTSGAEVSISLQLQGFATEYAALLRHLDRLEELAEDIVEHDEQISALETELSDTDEADDSYEEQGKLLDDLLENRNNMSTKSVSLRDFVSDDFQALTDRLQAILDDR